MKNKRPYVPPVKKIELSERNIKARWILIILLLALGVTAIFVGLSSMLNTEPGWQTVEVSLRETNCSREFTLKYDLSSAGSGATAQLKQLNTLYSEACVKAYRLFSTEVVEDGFYNVGYLNAHVNEPVWVEEELYEALSLAAGYGTRQVFMAPAAVEYNRVFLCESEAEAMLYAPTRNEDTAAWLEELGRFVSDPEMIRLELVGEEQVQLTVAQEYLDFARENEIEVFFDFGWMRNAFIADYLASVLVENGFTHGYLASFDGFTRNLDDRGMTYQLNIFDRKGMDVYMPAQMGYTGPAAIVSLRDYPLGDADRWHYFAFSDGEILSLMLDPATGLPRTSAANLICYGGFTCGEILLRAEKLFIGESLDGDTLASLAEEEIFSVWFEDWNLCHNDPELTVNQNPDSGGERYSVIMK